MPVPGELLPSSCELGYLPSSISLSSSIPPLPSNHHKTKTKYSSMQARWYYTSTINNVTILKPALLLNAKCGAILNRATEGKRWADMFTQNISQSPTKSHGR